jgi:hypothetical protein
MIIRRLFLKSIFLIVITFFSVIFCVNSEGVLAAGDRSLVAGDIIATGNVKMQVIESQWIDLNSSSMPVFSESTITTGKGEATLSLNDRTLIEISEYTSLFIKSDDTFMQVTVEKGGIRFLLPSNSNTLIETPSAIVGNRGSYAVAATGNISLRIDASEKVGEILVNDDGSSLINALKGNIPVKPLNSNESTIVPSGELLQVAQLENIPLPTPIPSSAPKEGYFWGWVSEKGAWEQVKLGTAPPTQSILMKDLPALPRGYVWGWDESQMRWVWLKVKEGDIVLMRAKVKDSLGNWYWEDVTKSSPVALETAKKEAVTGQSNISTGYLLGGLAVIGAAAGAAGGGGGGGSASPSS